MGIGWLGAGWFGLFRFLLAFVGWVWCGVVWFEVGLGVFEVVWLGRGWFEVGFWIEVSLGLTLISVRGRGEHRYVYNPSARLVGSTWSHPHLLGGWLRSAPGALWPEA